MDGLSLAWLRIRGAFEEDVAAQLDAHRDDILGAADGVTDTWLDKVTTAVADNLTHGGVSNLEWGDVKKAVIASEPQIDEATNERVSALFDAFVAALKKNATTN